MYDSHCHLDFPELASALPDHLARARARGVEGWHVPGCGPSQWRRLESVRQLADVTISVGVHPWWALEAAPEGRAGAALEESLQLMMAEARRLGAVAIGEVGLDRPRARSAGPSRALQRSLLAGQLEVARQLGLPVVLHVVGEHGAALEILERAGALPAGGVVHGYSGSAELVDRYVGLGLCLGLGTRLTDPKARKAKESLMRVPLDHLLLETDAPDQAPHPPGGGPPGRRGLPEDLEAVLGAAARQRGMSPGELAAITTRNARRLFAPARVGARSASC